MVSACGVSFLHWFEGGWHERVPNGGFAADRYPPHWAG